MRYALLKEPVRVVDRHLVCGCARVRVAEEPGTGDLEMTALLLLHHVAALVLAQAVALADQRDSPRVEQLERAPFGCGFYEFKIIRD